MSNEKFTGGLAPVSDRVLAAFGRAAVHAEDETARVCLANDSPHESMGPEAEAMVRAGMKFVTAMLRASMRFASGEIIADEIEWGRTRLPVNGVSPAMVLRNFERYRRALQKNLSADDFAAIGPCLDDLIKRQRDVAGWEEKGSESK